MPIPPSSLAPTLDARPASRRGSAMVETVLAAPVILFFAVVMFGFGVAFKRVGPAQNAARHDVWRQTTPGSPGPQTDGTVGQAFYPKDRPDTLTRIPDPAGDFGTEISQPILDNLDGDAAALATDLFQRLPTGAGTTVKVQHNSGNRIINQLDLASPISRHAARLDGDWRFAGGIRYESSNIASYYTDPGNPDGGGWSPRKDSRDLNEAADIKTHFVAEFDATLPSNALGNGFRGVYTTQPDYHGPNWARRLAP